MKTRLTLTLLALNAAIAAAAPAASPIKLTASTTLVRTVTENGKSVERLTDAANALPGSLLQMTQKVQNVSPSRVSGLRLNMRVDPATIYQSSNCDAEGTTTVFSIDNGKTFSAKPTKTVKVTENGKEVQKTVPAAPSEYTNLRWQLPDLAVNQTINCNLRVRVR